MAFNPFLSMGEPAAPVAAEALNPFMMEPAEGDFPADNPFAAGNPFSDFSGFAAEPERPAKPTELPLPPRPPPPRPLPADTQSLIQSVTGQLEATSSHLLGRIPPTRSPSPVSQRDLHSRSPSPPPLDINRNKPARPPPPPRPAPPPRPGDEINLFEAPPPAPPARPSTQHILSLYSQPAAPSTPQPLDFLSSDVPLPPAAAPTPPSTVPAGPLHPHAATPTMDAEIEPELESEVHSAADVFAAAETPDALPAPQPPAAPMDCSEPPPESSPFTTDSSPAAAVNNPFADFAAEPSTADSAETSPFGAGSVGMFRSETPNAFETGRKVSIDAPITNTFGEATTNVFTTASTNIFESAPVNVFSSSSTNEFKSAPTNVFDSAPTEDGFDYGATNAFTASSTDAFESATSNVFCNDSTTAIETPAAAETKGSSDAFTTETANAFGADSGDVFGVASSNAFGAGSGNAFGANSGDTFGASSDDAFGVPSGDAFGSPRGGFEPMQTESPRQVVADGWGEPAHHEDAFPESQDAFDAFSAKFDSTSNNHVASGAWGGAEGADGATEAGFEAEGFDEFLSLSAPPATPRLPHQGSTDSDNDNFSLFIRPVTGALSGGVPAPLAPPPRPVALPDEPRANPFDATDVPQPYVHAEEGSEAGRSGGETPPTPLFDEDTSQPLEDFPRTTYAGPGWEMYLRQPNKKKITGQRFWKKIFVRLVMQGDNPVVQLLNGPTDKEPFQELPLQACYSVSEVGAQQFDQFGKIFTVKLQYVFYKERPGVRPGQVTKAERITNKLSQFAAYAIQGDYQGVKEFGSDLRKLGLPVEHAPQLSQLFKIGALSYEDVRQFSCCVEEALFRLPAHRDRALTYKMEEVQITAVDELYVEQDAEGSVLKQIARVRLFFLGFLSGMPDVEIGVNDLRRQGREVVGRHDIIPVVTEEWIRVEDTEYHACVQPEEFTKTQIIKFKPPDACYIELMRFRVRPPKNRELPLQLKAVWVVIGTKVELRADVLVPGFASRKLGQVPCEDVSIRFPIPECWIYLFRVEKHFRYGSVKSAHRRTGKIKGIERFLGAVDTLQESLIEVTSGQAKYEHQHRAIVWRMPRLPKEGQGAYTTHNLVCRMALTSSDQVPEQLAPHAYVEFTMPATGVSHVTVRSVSLQNYDCDPPEKYVRYLARHEYLVGIERTSRQDAPAYALVTKPDPPPAPPAAAAAAAAPLPQPPSSDSDSD